MNEIETIVAEAETTETTEALFAFATVASVENDGLTLKIDGDENASSKKYLCNSFFAFAVGDRVLALKQSGTYVVICKIGAPGGAVAKTAGMTQSVGIDKNTGKLYTTPPSSQSTEGQTYTNPTIIGNAIKIGRSPSPYYDYVGFFGASPVSRQTISLTSEQITKVTESNYLTVLNNILNALQKLGLVSY